MHLSTSQKSGWIQAIFNIFVLWGLNSVFLGYCSKILGANAMLYTCTMFISAAFVLLLYAGAGTLSRETLRSVDTWGYGFALLFGFLTLFKLFSLVTAAEGALLQRLSIVASILVGWFFLSKNITPIKGIGALAVLSGIIWICAGTNPDSRVTIYSLVFLFSFIQAARLLIAELHKPHNAASAKTQDPKAKCRVVGYVLFVVAILFLGISFTGALVYEYTGDYIFMGMPHLSDFTKAENILSGLIAGVFLAAPIRLIEFSSAQKIKADNFLAITCLGSFATLFWEWLTSPLTGLSLREFSLSDTFAGILITLGGLIIALSNMKKPMMEVLHDHLTISPQDIDQVEDSREIVANTLEHFEGDMEKSANALELPVQVVKALFMDKDKVLAFKDSVLKEVARKYRRNVALSDALTGLSNRAGFMTALKGAAYETDVFSVIFIDLDKFKPVNDTYGHDAGDFVLKGVAERLGEMFPKRALATRLGGDEFCVLLLDKNKAEAEALIPQIQEAVAQPFKFEGNTFSVSASMGIASFPEDSENAEELLKLADNGMYSEKKER